MIEDIIIHGKCGIPLELCVCNGPHDAKQLSEVKCSLCSEEWVAIHPPGIPYSDFECIECGEFGCIHEFQFSERE